jgi:hypothetical protein
MAKIGAVATRYVVHIASEVQDVTPFEALSA